VGGTRFRVARLRQRVAAGAQSGGLIEFKAAQYAGGRGEYGGRGRPDCERVWKRFASILRAMRSVGFATILDLDAYEGLATVFKAKRQPKYHDP